MKKDADNLTVSQKVIIAAYKLEQQGQTPFTAEALIVMAWKNSPKTFGLKGFPDEYPDSNKVLIHVMGKRGLARRGWFIKVGQKLYTLSKQGKEEARRIILEGDDPLPKRRALAKIQVPKEVERHLEELFVTTAYRRFKDGMKREITYKDACKFWSLNETASGDTVDNVLKRIPTTLKILEDMMNGDTVELSNGQYVSKQDIESLVATNQFLCTQFFRHLAQQKDRTRRF